MQVSTSTLKRTAQLSAIVAEHCQTSNITQVTVTPLHYAMSWKQANVSVTAKVRDGRFFLSAQQESVVTGDPEVVRTFLRSLRINGMEDSMNNDHETERLRKQYPTRFVRYWDKDGFFVKVMNNHPVLKSVSLTRTSRVRKAYTYVSQQDFSRFCKEFYIVMGVDLDASSFKDRRSNRSSRIRSYKRVEV